MHNLIAFTFPEMGQGLLAVVILGGVLLGSVAALTMIVVAAKVCFAQAARLMIRRRPIKIGAPVRVRVPSR